MPAPRAFTSVPRVSWAARFASRPRQRAVLAALDEALAGQVADMLTRHAAGRPDRQGIGGSSAGAPDVLPS